MSLFLKFLLNPGFRLVVVHSFVHYLFKRRLLRPLGLILWQFEVVFTACHISPRCALPRDIVFPHPVGIVIGDGVRLGSNVIVYQNVTIGLLNRNGHHYPEISNNCIIYAGAVVVGKIVLQDGAVVKANEVIR